jgi:hypothetical protein
VLTEPKTGAQFTESLLYYMGIPASWGGWPGIVQPFVQLGWWSGVLTFGSTWAGYGLVAATALTWLAAGIQGWRQRHRAHGREVLLLVSLALIPVAWVLLLPRHTDIHAGMMVRLLVVPISLAPLALCWPPPRGRRSVPSWM